MDCHNKSDAASGANGNETRAHGLHTVLMILCCGLPVLILVLIPFISQWNNSGVGAFLRSYAWLLCPLLMIPMMFMMKGLKRHHAQP